MAVINFIINKRYEKMFSESANHVALKGMAIKMLRKLGAERVKTENNFAGFTVDVVGWFRRWDGHVTVAFECGNCEEERIKKLKEIYDVVVHLPYCYTPEITMPSLKTLVDRLENRVIVCPG